MPLSLVGDVIPAAVDFGAGSLIGCARRGEIDPGGRVS
jgi:hypothetical protein